MTIGIWIKWDTVAFGDFDAVYKNIPRVLKGLYVLIDLLGCSTAVGCLSKPVRCKATYHIAREVSSEH